MLKRKSYFFATAAIAVAVLVLAAGGCSKDDPTQPEDSAAGDVTLSSAKVSVGGQSLDGLDIRQGDYAGPMHYEARLADHEGNPVAGGRVQVQFGVSGMMGHMDGYMHLGEFYCYDDGTHGDHVPGDGVYCFDDEAGEYGCHRDDARPGEYHYEFCGFDQHGHESNRMEVTVHLVG
jgi:hypothetical protein